jgi:prepilin-type N-terminal cleavage/methylation domain-containing protein
MNLSLGRYSSDKSQRGFTLVEVTVVAALVGFLSVILITNFSRKRVDIDQVTNLIISKIREAQTKTVASAFYNGYIPCGYGIHYVNATQIALYVGPNASTTVCTGINRNYQSAQDTLQTPVSFSDSKVVLTGAFNDIFFEPPDPKTYLNNVFSLSQSPITLGLQVSGGTCPQNCRTIYVYPSGKIEAQ